MYAPCQDTASLTAMAGTEHILSTEPAAFSWSQISMSVGPAGTAAPTIPFALTWMADMIADVLMERTAQGTASMMEKLSTTVRFGCWKMTGALCAHVRLVSIKMRHHFY